jgi:hypothetical protein
MAKAGKKKSKPANNVQGTPQTVKFRKKSGINEVDQEKLHAKTGDTVTFQNDLDAVAILLFEPTIGLNNPDGTPAGVEIAPDVRVIVVRKGKPAGPFGATALRSTDVHVPYMVVVDPSDGGGNIGHRGPHVRAQDPEIIISG